MIKIIQMSRFSGKCVGFNLLISFVVFGILVTLATLTMVGVTRLEDDIKTKTENIDTSISMIKSSGILLSQLATTAGMYLISAILFGIEWSIHQIYLKAAQNIQEQMERGEIPIPI